MFNAKEWVKRLSDSDNFINLFFDEVNKSSEEDGMVLVLKVLNNLPEDRRYALTFSDAYEKFVRKHEFTVRDEEKRTKIRERAVREWEEENHIVGEG